MKSTPASRLGRDFWIYRAGQLVSIVGDATGSIALAWWVLEKTGSAAAMSAVLAPAMLARILLLPLLGPLGDRFDRKKLIVASEAWRAGLVALLAALAWVDEYRASLLVTIYVLYSAGSALFGAAATGFLPRIVEHDDLPRAYRQSHAISSIGTILGGVIGGVIVSLVGIKGAFLFDAATFVLAAAATLLIRPRPPEVAADRPAASVAVFARELVEGFAVLRRIPVLFWLCVVALSLNLVLSPLGVALPVLAKQGRGLPPWFLGALESAVGTGAVLGAIALGRIAHRFAGAKLVVAGITLLGVGVAALPWLPGAWLPLVAMFALGLGGATANIPLSTQVSLALPDDYRSRIGSIMGFVAEGVAPIGLMLSGLFIERWGLTATLTAMGAATVGLAPLLLAIPRFSAFFGANPVEAKGFFAKHYPDAFAKPVTEIENAGALAI